LANAASYEGDGQVRYRVWGRWHCRRTPRCQIPMFIIAHVAWYCRLISQKPTSRQPSPSQAKPRKPPSRRARAKPPAKPPSQAKPPAAKPSRQPSRQPGASGSSLAYAGFPVHAVIPGCRGCLRLAFWYPGEATGAPGARAPSSRTASAECEPRHPVVEKKGRVRGFLGGALRCLADSEAPPQKKSFCGKPRLGVLAWFECLKWRASHYSGWFDMIKQCRRAVVHCHRCHHLNDNRRPSVGPWIFFIKQMV
jgi:hypothetical protein